MQVRLTASYSNTEYIAVSEHVDCLWHIHIQAAFEQACIYIAGHYQETSSGVFGSISQYDCKWEATAGTAKWSGIIRKKVIYVLDSQASGITDGTWAETTDSDGEPIHSITWTERGEWKRVPSP